jgi:hypothetical protein
MGVIRMFSSCSSHDVIVKEKIVEVKVPTLPNPDPTNFRMIRVERIGDFVLALVNYPDCINYEGNKILVFHSPETINFTKLRKLDPHFCDVCKVSPIARFEPTERGWSWARKFAGAVQ